ncbi:MAG: hypothetical protein HYW85_03170, partial [Deltaproteobacteria bacterium]|nr:hypothetical protein [Deltaproteobacteria bacterium]
MKQKNIVFKVFLIWALIFQLSIGVIVPSLYAGDGDTYKEAPWPLSILDDELSATAQTPEVQADITRVEEGARAIEEG